MGKRVVHAADCDGYACRETLEAPTARLLERELDMSGWRVTPGKARRRTRFICPSCTAKGVE